jgi:cytochrome c oxidase subunit 3
VSDHTGGHPRFLHHHFDTPQQQFNSDKLGMWLFLVTEILLFGGLFCAYAVYRANHPEIFVYAHKFLDKNLGALNTVVLIFSSLTMALAVRAAQTSNKKALLIFLGITVACAFTFMGVKYVEYKAKWQHGLLPGKSYNPAAHETHDASADGAHEEGAAHGATSAANTEQPADDDAPAYTPEDHAREEAAAEAGIVPAANPNEPLVIEKSAIKPAAVGPAGLAEEAAGADAHAAVDEPKNVQLFFSIYFLMTGLHGLHVLVGIIVIFIIMYYSSKGCYDAEYFTPVELTGLYWHLVDLIWIYLFPLLYLIH